MYDKEKKYIGLDNQANKIKFIQVARFSPLKNHKLVVDAVAKLPEVVLNKIIIIFTKSYNNVFSLIKMGKLSSNANSSTVVFSFETSKSFGGVLVYDNFAISK